MRCSIGKLELNGSEKVNVKVEWLKPANRMGIIRKYILEGSCVGRFKEGSAIAFPQSELLDPDEKLNSYQLLLSSMPSFSTCNFYVAAETRVGIGEKAHCHIQTPLICNFIFTLFELYLHFSSIKTDF